VAQVPLVGEILSAVAALAWAVGVVLFRRTGETTPPLSLNLFKNVIAVVLLIPTLLVVGVPLFPQRPLADWLLLAASALVGISIADTLFFLALNRLGAGLVAVVDTLYSPAVILLAAVFLGERLDPRVFIGAALILAAIALGAAERPPAGSTRRDIAIGVLIAAFCMILMAAGIVMIKRLLDSAPVLWVSFVRLSVGGLGLLPLALAGRSRAGTLAILRPSSLWWRAVPAAVLAAYVGMIAWIGGMKYTTASIASVLNQLSTIFIFVLAALFLGEQWTARRTVAVVLAVVGAVLVSLP
jgi:drug/metabolite transporter (DMT)-like permease